MFAELFSHFTAGPSRSVREMGYLAEVSGIRGRYRRCKTFWEPHLEQSRATILRGMEGGTQRRKAIILGAGLLHDVPLAELSATFREVVLVDLVFPLTSRWETKKYANVSRVSADVTESIDAIYGVAADPRQPLPVAEPRLFVDDPEVDFSVSLNLLSQLPCMPMAYIKKTAPRPKEEVEEFARKMIRAHLDYLNRLPGRVTLITDFERLKFNLMRQVVERRDLFFGLRLPKWGTEWEWQLAPCPEADPQHHYFRRVVGIADWK